MDNPFYGKLESDFEFYQQLVDRFQYKHQVTNFQSRVNWNNYTVIGLHVRAGNGEKGDFEDKNRGIANETQWAENVAALFDIWTRTDTERFAAKPPMVFLATDGPSMVTKLTRALQPYNIPLLTAPQSRVAEGTGIAAIYRHNGTAYCFDTWRTQLLDMLLLAYSDVVVAGRYSSFTQTIPLTFQFAQNGSFCEVGMEGFHMECFDSYTSWLLHDQPAQRYGQPGGTRQHVAQQIYLIQGYRLTKENLMSIFDGASLQLDFVNDTDSKT